MSADAALLSAISADYDTNVIPSILEYCRVPNISPAFDANWATNGLLDAATDILVNWVKKQEVAGLAIEVVRLDGRTPLIFVEIDGSVANKSILMYGHLDKQPPFEGWEQGLGPYDPVIRDDKLYARGGADDGYAIYAAVTAVKHLKANNIPHGRIVIIVEACEESGSFDLPHYVDHLKERIGSPSLIVCLDSGCGNYETLWATTSLRGMIAGDLNIQIITEGVHSGDASGVVPSTFRIARQLLSRIEDENTGEIKLKELHYDIPAQRLKQVEEASKELGKSLYERFPFVRGAQPVSTDLVTASVNRTWKPTLCVTGAAGLPSLAIAGNVLRPSTSLKLSIRIPPNVNAKDAAAAVKRVLEANPPYGAKVEFDVQKDGSGWEAPPLAPWLQASADAAAKAIYGNPCRYIGEGGSIPFMGMLGEKYPQAQFFITGVLGPNSNAHGPNEFLHIPFVKKLTTCVAMIVRDHASS